MALAFNEAFNQHDVKSLLQLLSRDCVFEDTAPAPDGRRYVGEESLEQFWQGYFKDFPHVCMSIEEIFGLGNRCIMRWRCDWGEAGGGQGHVRGVDIFNVREGLHLRKIILLQGLRKATICHRRSFMQKVTNPDSRDVIKSIVFLLIYVIVIGVTAFFLLVDHWYIWLAIVLAGMLMLVNWHKQKTAYRCPNCDHIYEISFLTRPACPARVQERRSLAVFTLPKLPGKKQDPYP